MELEGLRETSGSVNATDRKVVYDPELSARALNDAKSHPYAMRCGICTLVTENPTPGAPHKIQTKFVLPKSDPVCD